MTKTSKYKIKLFVTLIFKYIIPIFIVPILLTMFFIGNHKLSLFNIGIIIFISGIISYIFNNIIDIIYIFYGFIFIIYDKLLSKYDNKNNVKILISIFISIGIILLINIIRLIIYKIYKGKKFIHKAEDIEILHYIFHPKKNI